MIDVATRQADADHLNDVGPRPWGIGVNADGTKLFTANGPAAILSIVDVATGARRSSDQPRRQSVGHRRRPAP